MNKTVRKKISKETAVLNNTVHQLDLTDTYRIFYPMAIEYTFFSSTLPTFFRVDPILGHRTKL